MSDNPFVLDKDSYKRNIDPVKHYIEQTAFFLNVRTNQPLEKCIEFVRKSIRNKELFPNIRDPKIRYFERQENGDRQEIEGTLLKYITDSVKSNHLIAPTLTTYLNPKEKKSLLVDYIDANVKARSVAKKLYLAAKANKDYLVSKIKELEQTNRKLANNAISGAHVSESTPLANKTAHSTLTSNCRSTSGYGNANNEKLLSGNRHYWNSSVTLNNIISIVSKTDLVYLEKVIEKYNIKYPNVEETMDCILYSSSQYWNDKKMLKNINDLVSDLTPVQRAAFVYVGDLYHLMKHNENLVRTFLTILSSKVTEGELEDPYAYVLKSNADHLNLAHQICTSEMKGKGKRYDEIKNTKELKTLALTVRNIKQTIDDYSDLIKALLVTENMPASVAYFPESIRKSALTSDTDSTIFTVQDWVKWFDGELKFSERNMALATSVVFISSQAIIHILAMMSANFGIEKERLHTVAMKNEYTFDVFVPTNVAKHYYAIKSCQEGDVYEEHETEIKGVHLKSSNSPKEITKAAADMMEDIMMTVYNNKKISIIKYLNQIANIERGIISSIARGDLTYFRLGELKTPDSYKKSEDESPYVYHKLWQAVFGDKYGIMPEPPYQTVKISTKLENPTITLQWLNEIQDINIKNNMINWLKINEKNKLPSINLPADLVRTNGIPKEIMDCINIRKIVYDICKIFYLILETLGYYICNDNMTKLVSDFY